MTINGNAIDGAIARVKRRIAELTPEPPTLETILNPDWIPTLRKAREAQGLSQREVGQRMETTQSAVSDLEHGRSVPQLETLVRYAAAVGYRMNVTFEPLAEETT